MASFLEDVEHEGSKEGTLPNIAHNTVEGTIFQPDELLPLWKAYRSWFSARGIVLYELRRLIDYVPIEHWCAPPVTASSPLPFATRLNPRSAETLGRPVRSKNGLGQDLLGNDVFIKLTDTHSNEHKINQYLLDLSRAQPNSKPSPFSYALCPTAVLDSPHNFSFVVMPCWGARFRVEEFDCLRVVLIFIKCLLMGLSFLHEHRIAHRDIWEPNILVNGYCPDLEESQSKNIIKDHLQSPNLAFTLFDYDLSLQLPPDVSLKHCRLPSSEGDRGPFHFHPKDISLGEPEYNPFAFDVGCMGNMFLYHFAEAIRVVPELAVLFAGMTTHVVDRRFTASEALTFFQDHFCDFPDDVLATPLLLTPNFESLNDPEVYWSLLSTEDSERWKDFRVPRRSWSQRLLQWVADTELGWKLLRVIVRNLVELPYGATNEKQDRISKYTGGNPFPSPMYWVGFGEFAYKTPASMNQSRALGQLRANPGPRTPLPSQNVVDESHLMYKPSKLPWVQLLFHPSDRNFAIGQSVQIYGIVPMYRTPSAGPLPNMPPTDSDTLYRYRSRSKLRTYSIATTDPISHLNLLPTRPLMNGIPVRPSSQMYVVDEPERAYYLKKPETVTFNNVKMDVPMHTGVTLQLACSRTRRQITTTSNLESVYYIVQVCIEQESWMYTNGAQGCYARDLGPVAPEKQININQWRLRAPRPVDASHLELHLRRGGIGAHSVESRSE